MRLPAAGYRAGAPASFSGPRVAGKLCLPRISSSTARFNRTNPVCSSCHSKMDPVGLGFEKFNGIGQWRTKDGKFDIDPSGTLPDGRSFKGAEDLKALIAKDAPKFAECVTDKLLTYALGRGLERYDRRTVKGISNRIAATNYRFSSLVLEIVNSLPFQMARQDRKKT